MKNADSEHIGIIYENAILMKAPVGDMLGGFDRLMGSSDEDEYEGEGEYEDEGEVEDDHNPEEEDPSEIHMARAELKKLKEYSDKLYNKMEEMEGLEGWVASKITKAADYLSSVYHWLDYEHGDDEGCGCEHEDCDCGYGDEEEYEDEGEDEDSETLRY